MIPPSPTLGALLRHLIEMLDGAVEEAYREAGLDYRARYTPIVRALQALGPASIRAISEQAGVTHSAVSQTVAQMALRGLVEARPVEDGRERIVGLTPAAEAMIPELERHWAVVEAAARSLDADIGASLPDTLRRAIAALAQRPFGRRIAQARRQG